MLELAFSPNGRVLASAGTDLRIIFWDMETFEPLAIIESGHTGWINSLAFSPDGQLLLSGSADGTIRVWDLTTMQPRVLDGNVGSVWDIAFDPRSLRFVSAGDQTLLWDITLPPRPGEAIIFAEQAIEQVLVVGDQLFIGEADGSIHIWQDGTHVKTLHGHTAPITSMDIQYNRLISSSADGQVLIWDGDSNRELLQLADPVWVVHWEEDSVLVAGDHPSILRLNPETGETIAEFSGVTGVLSLVTDGQYIIAGERNGMIHVWDDEGLRYSISAHESAVTSLLLDGDMLISAGRDRTIKLWDVQTGELLQPPLVGHTDWVLDIALGYQMLASAGRDGTVRLWSLPEGRPLGNALTGHFDWVTTVAFRDGVLYSAGHDQTVIAWDIALDDWLSLACRISNRNLTMQEWRQYFPDEVYRQTCPVTE
ncbi:MAG: hypothetical protein CUN56_14305 [Phototrophicales bacterium]|nr:MAG: hypothetical protein CUN56_14305 [Phototrophicales bacterium]